MQDQATWTPEEILKTSGAYWQSFTLHAAVKLDIFSLVEDGLNTIDALADELTADSRALNMFLLALVAMGLIKKNGDVFENLEHSRTFLVKHSTQYFGSIILHSYNSVKSWSMLVEAVTSGRSDKNILDMPEDERRNFLMGMNVLATINSKNAAEAVDLSGCRHLLDLGGGPGTYSICFCKKNPDLKATIYDLIETEKIAEQMVNDAGLNQRIDFMAGNFVEDEINGSYDAAWISHILHGESFDTCVKILKKAASSMQPGSKIFVHDFILDNDGAGPLFPAVFSLNMLVNTQEGQSYTENEISNMFQQVGLCDIERLSFRGDNDSGIICGCV